MSGRILPSSGTVLAILDQTLFAGSNFLMSMLMGRWLSPAEYGAFSAVYTTFQLAGAAHAAFVVDPMMVFGSGRYRSWFRVYLRQVVRLHWIVSGVPAVAVALLAGVWMRFGGSVVAVASMGIALAAPFILLQWVYRRAFYVELHPGASARGGAVYMVVALALVSVLAWSGRLSAASSFICMGVGSALVSVLFALELRSPKGASPAESRREVIHEHAVYGRWSVPTSALMWVPSNIYYILLPAVSGLAAGGALQASMNAVMPVLHVSGAVGTLLVPVFVGYIVDGRLAELKHQVRRTLAWMTLMAAGYLVVVALFAPQLLRLLYGAQYAGYGTLVLLAAIIPLSANVVTVIGSLLRAHERPDKVFTAYGWAAAASLTVGPFLVLEFGLYGAVTAMLLTSIVTAASMAYGYRGLAAAAVSN